jgi:hypothetical protein
LGDWRIVSKPASNAAIVNGFTSAIIHLMVERIVIAINPLKGMPHQNMSQSCWYVTPFGPVYRHPILEV